MRVRSQVIQSSDARKLCIHEHTTNAHMQLGVAWARAHIHIVSAHTFSSCQIGNRCFKVRTELRKQLINHFKVLAPIMAPDSDIPLRVPQTLYLQIHRSYADANDVKSELTTGPFPFEEQIHAPAHTPAGYTNRPRRAEST